MAVKIDHGKFPPPDEPDIAANAVEFIVSDSLTRCILPRVRPRLENACRRPTGGPHEPRFPIAEAIGVHERELQPVDNTGKIFSLNPLCTWKVSPPSVEQRGRQAKRVEEARSQRP